jgi:uncharacterized protein YcgI (DUF1989 family)
MLIQSDSKMNIQTFSSLPKEYQKVWFNHYLEMLNQCPPIDAFTKKESWLMGYADVSVGPRHWYTDEKKYITCHKSFHMTAEQATSTYGIVVDDGIGTFEIFYDVVIDGISVIQKTRFILATYCDGIVGIVCYFPK